jgi:hypothetical protein
MRKIPNTDAAIMPPNTGHPLYVLTTLRNAPKYLARLPARFGSAVSINQVARRLSGCWNPLLQEGAILIRRWSK